VNHFRLQRPDVEHAFCFSAFTLRWAAGIAKQEAPARDGAMPISARLAALDRTIEFGRRETARAIAMLMLR
jgi:hypothetical protein